MTFWAPALGAGPVTSKALLYWLSWPTFSSSVICARRASIFFSVAGFTRPWAPAPGMKATDSASAPANRTTCIESLPG